MIKIFGIQTENIWIPSWNYFESKLKLFGIQDENICGSKLKLFGFQAENIWHPLGVVCEKCRKVFSFVCSREASLSWIKIIFTQILFWSSKYVIWKTFLDHTNIWLQKYFWIKRKYLIAKIFLDNTNIENAILKNPSVAAQSVF